MTYDIIDIYKIIFLHFVNSQIFQNKFLKMLTYFPIYFTYKIYMLFCEKKFDCVIPVQCISNLSKVNAFTKNNDAIVEIRGKVLYNQFDFRASNMS